MNDIEIILKKEIINIAPNISIEQINENTNLIDDLMFDSLLVMQLIVNIEHKFNIKIDYTDYLFDNLIRFSSLLNVLRKATLKNRI